MAIIVVGGGGRGAGKTALICGLIRALPEIPWTAIKITDHEHGKAAPVWEETTAGQESDTGRYLTAGARRALQVTTSTDAGLDAIVEQILKECSPAGGAIFESNCVLDCMRADLCLAALSSPWSGHKPWFDLVEQRMDAMVELAGHDHVIPGDRMHFHLTSLERISEPMLAWLRERLENTAA